jgi:glyoxylase-like metal-dependent hydrolase (beta-lactamase superfamily II)
MKIEWVQVTRYEQNCSILWCERTHKAAVIDPGGDLDSILFVLEAENLTLDRVLVTHGHMDHCGGAAALAAEKGVPIEGPHIGDLTLIEKVGEMGAKYGVPHAKPYTPERWLVQGDRVRFGDVELEVRHCPGHSPGHVAYFHAPSKFAVVGDLLFQGTIGTWKAPGGDFLTLFRSIRENLLPLGDDVTFLPGHGETSTFGIERQRNVFVSDEAAVRVAKMMKDPSLAQSFAGNPRNSTAETF